MEKCMTGRLGFHPGGADVRVEYVRARERIVLTCDILCGTDSSRRALVSERLWVRDSSNSTKDFTQDKRDLLVPLLIIEELLTLGSVVELLHSISMLDCC